MKSENYKLSSLIIAMFNNKYLIIYKKTNTFIKEHMEFVTNSIYSYNWFFKEIYIMYNEL